MKTYAVTAGNRYFWQTLVVTAHDEQEAAQKFTAFLAQPEERAAEDEEYQMGLEAAAISNTAYDVSGHKPEPNDYHYCFDADDIEEENYFPHWAGTPNPHVQRTGSGGNG